MVFPYQHPRGRYHLSFLGAQQACKEQDSTVATVTQLFQSWKEGMNWCNAGWLADGTVQYPITQSREPCGGARLAPGVRHYDRFHLYPNHYDVFCFSSLLQGEAKQKVMRGQQGHREAKVILSGHFLMCNCVFLTVTCQDAHTDKD